MFRNLVKISKIKQIGKKNDVYSCEQCNFSQDYITEWSDLELNECIADYIGITKKEVNLLIKIERKDDDDDDDEQNRICGFCESDMFDIDRKILCLHCILKLYFSGKCRVCNKLGCNECRIHFKYKALCDSCRHSGYTICLFCDNGAFKSNHCKCGQYYGMCFTCKRQGDTFRTNCGKCDKIYCLSSSNCIPIRKGNKVYCVNCLP